LFTRLGPQGRPVSQKVSGESKKDQRRAPEKNQKRIWRKVGGGDKIEQGNESLHGKEKKKKKKRLWFWFCVGKG